jgi:hypothetical protein
MEDEDVNHFKGTLINGGSVSQPMFETFRSFNDGTWEGKGYIKKTN